MSTTQVFLELPICLDWILYQNYLETTTIATLFKQKHLHEIFYAKKVPKGSKATTYL